MGEVRSKENVVRKSFDWGRKLGNVLGKSETSYRSGFFKFFYKQSKSFYKFLELFKFHRFYMAVSGGIFVYFPIQNHQS